MDERTSKLIFSPDFLYLAMGFVLEKKGDYSFNDEILFLHHSSKVLSCPEIKTDESARQLIKDILSDTKDLYLNSGPEEFIKKLKSLKSRPYILIKLEKAYFFAKKYIFNYRLLVKHLTALLVILGLISLGYIFKNGYGKTVILPTDINSVKNFSPGLSGETVAKIIVSEISKIELEQKTALFVLKKFRLNELYYFKGIPVKIEFSPDFFFGLSGSIKQIENIELAGTKIPSELILILLKPLNPILKRRLISTNVYPFNGNLYIHAIDDEHKSLFASSLEANKAFKFPLNAEPVSSQYEKKSIENITSVATILAYKIFFAADSDVVSESIWEESFLHIKGWNALYKGHHQNAGQYFENSHKLNPYSFKSNFSLGIYNYVTQNPDRARENFMNCTQLQTNSHEDFLALGVMFYRLAKISREKSEGEILRAKAVECLELAISLNDQFEEAYLAKGFVLLESEKYQEAIESLSMAFGLDHKKIITKILLGASYLHIDNYKESIVWSNRAIAEDHQNVAALNNLSAAYLYLKKPQLSIQYLSQALEVRPLNDSYHAQLISNLGLAQYLNSEFALAISSYEKALTLIKHPIARAKIESNIAFTLLEQGSADKAVEVWDKVFKKHPDYIEAMAGLSVGLFAIGEKNKALKYFHEIVTKKPEYKNIQTLQTKHFWQKRAIAIVSERIQQNIE
ncbi:MAG: hypothetical protein JSV38_00780 [Desulfobacterales bacterium]|nr:MAG: hypothetical protein JSV38_00780 [Desulfobacterales bacterium]